MISFQLYDNHEQFAQYPTSILLPSLSSLLAARLRIAPERIRLLNLGKENGASISNFIELINEILLCSRTNDHHISIIRISITNAYQ